jgi:hypothetical protein
LYKIQKKIKTRVIRKTIRKKQKTKILKTIQSLKARKSRKYKIKIKINMLIISTSKEMLEDLRQKELGLCSREEGTISKEEGIGEEEV